MSQGQPVTLESLCPSSWDTLLSCLLQFSCISHDDKLWKALLIFLPSSLIFHCLHKYCKLKVYFLAPDGQRAALNLKPDGWPVSLQSGLFPLVATCTNPYPDSTGPCPLVSHNCSYKNLVSYCLLSRLFASWPTHFTGDLLCPTSAFLQASFQFQ